MNKIELPFTEHDAQRAYDDWFCNCGPSALAFILGITLEQVRPFVDAAGFASKRYMSPTMMKAALNKSGARFTENRIAHLLIEQMRFPKHGLARIQWEGPWTMPGANPKWAYWHTHWVASRQQKGVNDADKVMAILDPVIFDINGGLMKFSEWVEDVVPALTAAIPRADGDWFVTHSWEVSKS